MPGPIGMSKKYTSPLQFNDNNVNLHAVLLTKSFAVAQKYKFLPRWWPRPNDLILVRSVYVRYEWSRISEPMKCHS